MNKEEIEYLVDEDEEGNINWPRCVALIFQYAATVALVMVIAQCASGKIW